VNTPQEITPETLKELRRGRTQAEIAEILGLTVPKISNIERGIRGLSTAEKRLLEWHLLGIAPPRVTTGPEAATLNFSQEEWQSIQRLAAAEKLSEAEWIAGKIRCFLSYLETSAAASKQSLDAASRTRPLRVVPEPLSQNTTGEKTGGQKA